MKNTERIAIVGMGAVLPGSRDIAHFWSHVLAGRSVAREVPAGRWPMDPARMKAAGVMPDKVYSTRGCFVEDFPLQMEGLDLPAGLVRRLDPMYQILLAAGKAAWRDAVTDKVDRRRAGVIIGNIALPTEGASAWTEEIWGELFEGRLRPAIKPRGNDVRGTHPLNRYVAGLPGGLLARGLGLGGGAFTLDAACASSLYAIKLAVEELLAGRADVMLTGGLSRPDSLYTQMGFSQLRALSKSGVCAPFDVRADGLVVGEGAGIFVLKRLGDALRDGDRIYATIAGIGLSNDIGGNLMLPDSEGQLRAMRAAYVHAGWKPETVDLIECHGTGTPIGDGVEYRSLMGLWNGNGRRGGKCVMGSVKSNVGHLLTAAGAAGLIKTLLAMRDGTLPPTANFMNAAEGMDMAAGPFEVLSAARVWEGNGPRRAAVSAFGFGGINAHMLLEQWQDGMATSVPQFGGPVGAATIDAGEVSTELAVAQESIAIVGMGACFGPWKNLRAFERRLFGEEAAATNPHGWRGSAEAGTHRGFFIDKVEVPVGRFRIPPAEMAEMLPQQLLMLQVAADALKDAKLEEIEGKRMDTGVFIGIGLDLNTTNFRFRWTMDEKAGGWAREMGSDMTPAELNRWVEQLRDASGPALTANRTMGALGGIVASRVARAFHVGGPAFTLSSEETSGLHALQMGVRALQRGELNVALVGAVDLAGDVRAVMGDEAVRQAGLIGEGAAALVLKRQADAVRDGDRIYAVIDGVAAGTGGGVDLPADERMLRNVEHQMMVGDAVRCAVGDLTTQIGNTGAASGMAAVVKAALSSWNRLIATPMGVQHWLRDREGGSRRTVVMGGSVDGNGAAVRLSASDECAARAAVHTLRGLFVVAAVDAAGLLADLTGLERMSAEWTGRIDTLSRKWFARGSVTGSQRAAIVSRSMAELRQKVHQLRSAIRDETRIAADGVFYSPSPMGGKVAFVFPGAGNAFTGMGREIAVLFPEVMQRLDRENGKLASQFAGGRFWMHGANADVSHQDEIFGQVWLGAMVSDVIASCGVKADGAIGYSLGETTSLFATRAWRGRDEMLRRMKVSTLFSQDLAGPCNAVRKAWGLKAADRVDWVVGVLDRTADAVRAELRGYDRAYLLIVNTPGECVVGGDRAAVEKLVRKMGCAWHPVEGVTTVHCEVARSVEQAYRDLHLMETTAPEGVMFYSGALGKSYAVTRESAAESVVRQAMEPFDFTKVIESAYADGVRLFVEMGPGNSCSRMIGKILGARLHVARSACVAGGELAALLETMAQLYAEGVGMDFSKLLGGWEEDGPFNGKVVSVPVGAGPFQVPGPPQRVKRHAPFQAMGHVKSYDVDDTAVSITPLMEQMAATHMAHARAQETYLRLSQENMEAMGAIATMQMALLGASSAQDVPEVQWSPILSPRQREVALDRDMCMEFAIGSIAKVLGPAFAHVDTYPTRVRLPDEPLMLVDRIVTIEGKAQSMTSGRVVTEHDVLQDGWYLDGGRIPTCIAVEAGQADLFLAGYLGIDSITRGNAVYRLLDAVVTFHGPLPVPGQTIVYDIAIDHFFRQGETYLFRFHFEATVDGMPVLTMKNGCAGFFTEQELAAGQGIVLTVFDKKQVPGKRPADWHDLVPMRTEAFSDEQVHLLRAGDLAACFGDAFGGLPLRHPVGLPSGKMTLVHRVLKLDPTAGRFGLGQIIGEADIRPDDWFMTCHFVDDRVMPGTLMYECCLHTLRIYLLRMGWVAEADAVVYEPVVGVSSTLKCRGQVMVTTRKVQYEVTLKEIGYQEDGTPYAIADALMYGDGRAIVQMTNMSVRLTGVTRAGLEAMWAERAEAAAATPLFDTDRITAFAIGKPSEAFGEPYRIFDAGRKIARLPGPPFQFLDRIVSIRDCQPFELAAGGIIEAEYDVPPDAWYFASNQQNRRADMPFSVLLEAALQPCGWLAAYLGSALASPVDIKFRNLGGSAVQLLQVTPDMGTLTTRIKITSVSNSGGMLIQHFDMAMRSRQGDVYRGTTYFGFFSKEALATQVGIRDAKIHIPTPADMGEAFATPDAAPFPDRTMRMVDRIDMFAPGGGKNGLGFIQGSTDVNAAAWFFKAHFFEDPVWPGSLGLESFLQLLKVVAHRRWGGDGAAVRFETMATGQKHSWVYRGQILPTDRRVTVQGTITAIDDATHTLRADGFLTVDGRIIYQMNDFAIRMHGFH